MDDLEAVLVDSALLTVGSPELTGSQRIACKAATSPLEDSAVRAIGYLQQEKHLFNAVGTEKPWELVAREMARFAGEQDADLDRRFLEHSPCFSITYSEVR